MDREFGDNRLACLEVHQHPQQQHRVVNLAARHRAEAAGRTLTQCDAALHLGRLGVKRGPEGAAHVQVGLDREHLMARARQPDGLRSLPGAHIEDSPGRRPQVFIELAGDHLLPDYVAHVSQLAEPGHTAITERAVSARIARIHHRDDIILIMRPVADPASGRSLRAVIAASLAQGMRRGPRPS